MTIWIKENIVSIQISVYDSILMKAFYPENDLTSIEFSLLLCKPDILSNMVKQLSSIQKVHDQVNFFRVLESKVQSNNEWIFNLL